MLEHVQLLFSSLSRCLVCFFFLISAGEIDRVNAVFVRVGDLSHSCALRLHSLDSVAEHSECRCLQLAYADPNKSKV